jgi:pimeloyl-ACP methyl ester carboxylesterase
VSNAWMKVQIEMVSFRCLKNRPALGVLCTAAIWSCVLHAQGGPHLDSNPHQQRFITVEEGVKLEVLDWGGTGRAVILLAGLDDDAHVLDAFASRLRQSYHVYGITRRGCGASSVPAPTVANYKADRLGDDVLAVIETLRLDRPVLIGHSIAGEELSSVGSRRPEKVAGLVYLDAVWPYSYYDQSVGNMRLDALDVQRNLDDLLSGITARQRQAAAALETNLPQFEKSLSAFRKQLAAMPPNTPGALPPVPPLNPASAISLGWQKYTKIPVPILALIAVPHDFSAALKKDPVTGRAEEAADRDRMEALARSFQAGVPTAHVVRIPNASHYIFNSNRDEVVREINSFIAGLP